ncbi:MAG: hypothetical protein ACRDQC_00125 [Gaiellales bacterium]
MDDLQEREVRSWAESLCQSPAADQRATGKAMLMLLAQIDSLRAELENQPIVLEGTVIEEEPIDGVETDSTRFEESIADTATISLRERLRSKTRRTTP